MSGITGRKLHYEDPCKHLTRMPRILSFVHPWLPLRHRHTKRSRYIGVDERSVTTNVAAVSAACLITVQDTRRRSSAPSRRPLHAEQQVIFMSASGQSWSLDDLKKTAHVLRSAFRDIDINDR
ncbi:hypothetical protein LSAT2_002743 [Lamellibrachia satsuma]|nr:hypothetical protein LSAT2_002743 [Lamellibrachia satsuma]